MKGLIKTTAVLLGVMLAIAAPVAAQEPTLSEYSNLPIFQSTAAKPNILVILSNTKSMNHCAYGTYPTEVGGSDGGEVTDETFAGATSATTNTLNVKVTQSTDDATELVWTTDSKLTPGTVYLGDNDLHMAQVRISGKMRLYTAGLRFQNVSVPPETTLTRAELVFTAAGKSSKAVAGATLTIAVEETDTAATYSSSLNDITSRSYSSTTVSWEVPEWASGGQYSVDVTALAQDIIDRGGWLEGNAMAFAVSSSSGEDAYRKAVSYDDNPAAAPTLQLTWEQPGAPPTGDPEIYYGLFDPTSRYSYASNKFSRDPSGDWDGNFLNWLTMRRIDVMRKVLIGGLMTARTGGGNGTVYGEPGAATSDIYWTRRFTCDGTFTPYTGQRWFGIKGGSLWVHTDNSTDLYQKSIADEYKLAIYKSETDEPQDFKDGKIVGIFQRIGERARWGVEWFYDGTGTNREGGRIIDACDDGNLTNLITDFNNQATDADYQPLSEAYYVAMQYFKQESVDSSLGYFANAANKADPYVDNETYCAKSFVLLLSDGLSTKDGQLPAQYRDYDGDGEDNATCDEYTETGCDYPTGGTDYLDDIALYARTNDLRSDLKDEQNMLLYVVYALGTNPTAAQLLQNAAKNGGFNDRNGNDFPDLQAEWDTNQDGVPDTYYEARNGYLLEQQLMAAINDILRRAASGTAVSVLATKGEGEGTLVQAFFKPGLVSGFDEVSWLGYLQSLWVDRFGNTREDTNNNLALDLDQDDIIRFFLDPDTNETKVKVFNVSSSDPYPDIDMDNPDDTKPLEEIDPIWEAGQKLAERDPDLRKIFTYTGSTDRTVAFDPSLKIDFTPANAGSLKSFFGVADNATWSYLGSNEDERSENLIYFVRGEDDGSIRYQGSTSMRTRTIDVNGIDRLWKLGDIVYSTPVSISKAVENYGLLYDDASYLEFYQKVQGRETVVYVGGNDGMLHAFTSGVYDAATDSFKRISQVSGYTGDLPDVLNVGDVAPGNELWAYIPQCQLPHLKWLPRTDYTKEKHVSFVDLKPKVIDAKIFDNATSHPNGWGTILLGGQNMGGGTITANGTTYTSSIFAIDVTNPRDPQLLWERTFSDLGFTVNQPSVTKVGNEWYLSVGSGPTDYTGSSNQNGHVYIIDLKTGGNVTYRDFATTESNTFMNTPVSLDKSLNYNVDAIYASANYLDGGAWKGRVYKIVVPQDATDYDPNSTDYKTNPADWTGLQQLFSIDRPITAPLTLSVDRRDNSWVFGGTGRYISDSDKDSTNSDATAQNYMFGFKDPFFNPDRNSSPNCYQQYGTACSLDMSDLFDADPYTIKSNGTVEVGAGGVGDVGTFAELLEETRKDTYDGWYRTLCDGSLSEAGIATFNDPSDDCNDSDGNPSERIVNKPSILGGIVLYPTFAPTANVCGFGGFGRLYALFFETGTAYKRRVVGDKAQETILDVVPLGEGMSSSFGVHVGREEGGTLFGQLSTGVIARIDVTPAYSPKSAPIYWRQSP